VVVATSLLLRLKGAVAVYLHHLPGEEVDGRLLPLGEGATTRRPREGGAAFLRPLPQEGAAKRRLLLLLLLLLLRVQVGEEVILLLLLRISHGVSPPFRRHQNP